MTPEQERHILRRTRELLADWGRPGDDFRLVEVELEGQPDSTAIVILFTHRDRPRCLLGSRWALVDSHPPDPLWDDPDERASTLYENFMEEVHDIRSDLPIDCNPSEIVWLEVDPAQ